MYRLKNLPLAVRHVRPCRSSFLDTGYANCQRATQELHSNRLKKRMDGCVVSVVLQLGTDQGTRSAVRYAVGRYTGGHVDMQKTLSDRHRPYWSKPLITEHHQFTLPDSRMKVHTRATLTCEFTGDHERIQCITSPNTMCHNRTT